MKNATRRIILILTAVLLVAMCTQNYIAQTSESHEGDTTIVQEEQEDNCTFCDEHEMTIKEKYEELLLKALIDEKNLLDEGYITKEVYELQCKPFNNILDNLDKMPQEELEEGYLEILYYHLDQNAEYKADGENIDEEFVNYIETEIKRIE